ncbi:hypothetical protein CHUAL_000028 [Chamberlinius hualienensis]
MSLSGLTTYQNLIGNLRRLDIKEIQSRFKCLKLRVKLCKTNGPGEFQEKTTFGANDWLCALHFEESMIVKDYIHIIEDVLEAETVGYPHLFLTKVTALGFRVTIKSTLDILQYCNEFKMDYLLTARLTQDILEHYFELIWQWKSASNTKRLCL